MKYVLLTNPDPIVTTDTPFGKPMKTVESPGRDILDYPVEEPKLDMEGNLIEIAKPPFYETTNRSLKWSVERGQTVEMPEYVANVLKSRYEFLEIVEIAKPEAGVPEEQTAPIAQPKEGETKCKYCGQIFKTTKGVALHMAHIHPDKIL